MPTFGFKSHSNFYPNFFAVLLNPDFYLPTQKQNLSSDRVLAPLLKYGPAFKQLQVGVPWTFNLLGLLLLQHRPHQPEITTNNRTVSGLQRPGV